MSVSVLFFGPLAAVAGPGPHGMELPAASSVQQLLDHCFAAWPALREWDSSLLIAVNRVYAGRGEIIPPHAEVAVMPPVQGG